MRRGYDRPAHEQEFERLCLVLLKKHWNCPGLELYSHRGERQDGVDIIDLSGSEPLRAAQCKLYDPTRSLPSGEIRAEVEKAKRFRFKLGRYVILTTAKVSRHAQEEILAINREHREAELFEVELKAWDQISDLLNDYPDVADRFYGEIPAAGVQEIREGLTGLRQSLGAIMTSQDGEQNGIDAEIDEAKGLIERAEPQIAQILLERIRQRKWDRLSERQKFRILSNLGASHLQRGEGFEAARLFLEAKQLQPDDEVALVNEARAHALLGEMDTAREVAAEARNRFPHSARAVGMWIYTAPDSSSAEVLASEVPGSVRTIADVTLAIAERALKDKNFVLAQESASAATEANPKEPYAWLLRGQAVLNNEIFRCEGDPSLLALAPNRERLAESVAYLSTAIELTYSPFRVELEATALVDRAMARELMGEVDLCADDIERARAKAPHSAVVLREYSRILHRRGQSSRAIELLRDALQLKRRSDLALLLAELLLGSGDPSQVAESGVLFAELATGEGPCSLGMREHCALAGLRAFAAGQQWREAEEMVDRFTAAWVSPSGAPLFRAWLRYHRGDPQGASSLADDALGLVSESGRVDESRALAKLLTELGRDADALPLWRRLGSSAALTDDTKQLLDCAARLDRDDVVLEVCGALREAGVTERTLMQLEVDALQKYDPDKAIAVLNDFLDRTSEDLEAHLFRSYLGIRLGREDLVAADTNRMPDPRDTPSVNWRLMVTVLQRSSDLWAPVKFAYALLRKNFSNADAHLAYWTAMSPEARLPDIGVPEAVGPGTAVCYREEGDEQDRWLILEEEFEPDASLGEQRADSTLGQKMMDSKPGGVVTLSSARKCVIKSILSKYVYRLQECLEMWEVRFPDIRAVEMIRVGPPEAADLSPILKRLDVIEEEAARVETVYRTGLVPLHMLGEKSGDNAMMTVVRRAFTPGFRLKCCLGTAEERAGAIRDFKSAGFVVLDLTAIATIFLLDADPGFLTFSGVLAISRGTMEVLEAQLREREPTENEKRSIGKMKGRLSLTTQSPEAQRNCHQALAQLIEVLKARCEIRQVAELAKIRPDDRRALVSAFGWEGAESIALASGKGRMLWTEDLAAARYGGSICGTRSIWTHAVLQTATESERLSGGAFYEAGAKLLGWGYHFTGISAQLLEKSGVLANWDPNAWPLAQALDEFAADYRDMRNLSALALAFLSSVYCHVSLPETRTALVIRLMERLASHRHGGVPAVARLGERLPWAFGVNVIGAREAAETISLWMKSRKVVSPQ